MIDPPAWTIRRKVFVVEPSDRLDEMISGFRATQVVRAGAMLGIPDALAAEPLASPAVASIVGADPDLVRRLMRCLAAIGVLTEFEDGRFANTEMGHLLCKETPGGMHSTALGRAEDGWWYAWAELPRGIKSGQVPYQLAHGRSFWDEERADPEAAARFNAFMTSMTERFLSVLLEHFDFSGASQIVDVGGGNGALVAGILRACPGLHGIVFDLESGLRGARDYLSRSGVESRCDLVAGSFFDLVPTGGDVYLLRQILHDWPDERATDILTVCRRSMQRGARLVVMDKLLPQRASDDRRDRLKFEFDLHMFVLFGGRERTEPELREMIEAAGFRVERVLPTEPESTLIAVAE